MAIWKLLRTNQLKNSSHEGRSWILEGTDSLKTAQRGWPLHPHRQKLAHCPNIMSTVQPEKGAQLWSSKGFSRTPSGHPCTSMQGFPNKCQKSRQQKLLPAAHRWRDALSSQQYFPDVQAPWAGRSSWRAQGRCLSLLTEEGVWLVPF